MNRAVCVSLCLLSLCVGCGPQAVIQPVSGTVTLNGKPLPGAVVRFMPKPQADPQAVMMLAMGKTDDQGKYSLEVFEGPPGAVVGVNRVTISTAIEHETEDRLIAKERVPPQYNIQSKLEFDVPAEGTENADFALEGKAWRRRR